MINKPVITVVMPAKNACQYIERSLGSVKNQTIIEKILVLLVYAPSTDNTLDEVTEYCKNNHINLEVYKEKGELNPEMTSSIIPSIQTKYFCFMCFSDEYLRSNYLSEAVEILETQSMYSFVHSNIYTMYRQPNSNIQFMRPGLHNRQLIPPQSGAAMFCNVVMMGDSINELTFVSRTSTAKILLGINNNSYKLRHNAFGSLFIGLFANGFIGYYISNFSTIGYHHENQAGMNPDVEKKCGLYRDKFNQLRSKLHMLITNQENFWKLPDMSPFPSSVQKKLTQEYKQQMEMIRLCAKYNLFTGN